MGAINYSQINAKCVYAIESDSFDEYYAPENYLKDVFPLNNDWVVGFTLRNAIRRYNRFIR